jgi:hypothetical protein
MNHTPNAVQALIAVFIFGAALVAVSQKPPKARVEPSLEAPVPLQKWTTADAGTLVLGAIPSPGPNQKRKCDPDRAEQEINGGCWVETTTPPPCPRGKQWEHEGRCWLPVAEAKPVPTSGGSSSPGVADP